MWNKEVFGDLITCKLSLMGELSSIDEEDEGGTLDEVGVERKVVVSRELDRLIDLEEISWRQKSRALWLKDGDRCTKFFHRVTNSNRRFNSISRLEMDREMVEDPGDISTKIVSFYTSLYKEPFSWRPSLEGLEFGSISREDADWLERPFEEKEIIGVVCNLNGDKAPGPDGFSLAFYQLCWEVVKRDVLLVFDEFAKHGRFARTLNASFIVLIPKKPGAVDLKDFLPISLVGGYL